jgi:hypothetical protein
MKGMKVKKMMLPERCLAMLFALSAGPAMADMAAAKKWVTGVPAVDAVQRIKARGNGVVHQSGATV